MEGKENGCLKCVCSTAKSKYERVTLPHVMFLHVDNLPLPHMCDKFDSMCLLSLEGLEI